MALIPMSSGTLVNPGDRDYVFANVPSFLSGGTYVGSRTWPKAGTWTIKRLGSAIKGCHLLKR